MSTTAKPVRTPRLSRAEQKTKRTATMLDAAWALFCEKGYEGATMDEVAEYAGVSRYPVYYAFGDKQNLFMELWKKKVGSGLDDIEPHLKRGALLKINMEGLAQWVVDEHANHPYGIDGLFYVVQTIGLSRPDIADKLQAVRTSIVDYITGVIDGSKLEPGQQLRAPSRSVAQQVIALVNGLSNMRSAVDKVAVDKADLTDAFMTITTRRKSG